MKINAETMTPRERWRTVFDHKKPDRVPMDYWGTPEITDKLIDFTHSQDRFEMLTKLKVDFVIAVSPKYIGPDLPKGVDVFSREGRSIDYGTGTYWEITFNPLAQFTSVEEIDANYIWPNPDWWDYSDIPQQVRGWDKYPLDLWLYQIQGPARDQRKIQNRNRYPNR